ncbi:MAG TPA: GNAT family N-acetyltransferase [Labilithrix sp.]|nr:GNAT family N-acetyltransferase [Labilithrix sp.]
MIAVERFAPRHLDGFGALFEAASSSCFCRYWHFTGTKNEWLDRCAHRPEENLAEQAAASRAGEPSASGLVALDEGTVVGWMKVAPREALPKLTSLPVYRHLPFEPGTWSIGCFVVHPASRRRGVARALVQGAVDQVPAWGGRFLEGHPRRSEAPLYDEEAWQGPERIFLELGFSAIHDQGPYPVYRKVLLPERT